MTLEAVAEAQRRVSVRCTNEDCPKREGGLQRSARTWDHKPCPVCASAVEISPGVVMPAPKPEPQAPRIAKPAPMTIQDRVRVPVEVYQWLRGKDRKAKPAEVASRVLVAAYAAEVGEGR